MLIRQQLEEKRGKYNAMFSLLTESLAFRSLRNQTLRLSFVIFRHSSHLSFAFFFFLFILAA